MSKLVPFFGLQQQYQLLKQEIDLAIANTLSEAYFVGGRAIQQFEEAFASYIGTKYCIGCANGTDALTILLRAFEVGQGDEVIVPALSWIATSGAVSATGATPVFVDINKYGTIDTKGILQVITDKTKAIIPVHLYGQMADMPAIMTIASQYNLIVIEDCAQAHGASQHDKKAGTWGHAAAFSFYPTKNLGAYGDAGAMLTNDPSIANMARRISNLGQLNIRHDHPIEGQNSRMDTIQANILLAKLPHLDAWNQKRRSIAEIYDQQLGMGMLVKRGNKHVYHIYAIKHPQRNELQRLLTEKGIGTQVHYPTALPFLFCYHDRGWKKSDFPNAYQMSQQTLSLPLYPELGTLQQLAVIETIQSFQTP